MEQYKLINAELMDQVQKQRILIGEMSKTEVLLKKLLMEEREIRLADAQHNENKIKCAVRTLLQSLNINLDSGINSPNTTRTAEDKKQSVYRQEEACLEAHRSNALLQRSRSHITNSVVNCNSSHKETEADEDNFYETILTPVKEVKMRKTPEPRRLVDLQVSSSPDTPEAEEHADTSSPNQISPPRTNVAALMYSIIEECDSEEETPPISLDETDTERRSMELSVLPLRDLTNKTTLHLNSPKACSISQIDINESENRCTPIMEKLEQLSIEHVRCAPRQSSPMHLTTLRNSMHSSVTLTNRPSQLNFSAFNGIVNRPDDCSTPQRNQESIKTERKTDKKPSKRTKPKTKPRSIKIEESSNNSSVLGRPSRSCRPKSLKEINCKTKMRNESK